MRKYIFTVVLAIALLSLQACVKEKTVQKDVPATTTQSTANATPQTEQTTSTTPVTVTQSTASAAPQVEKTPVTTTETIKPIQTTASATVSQSNPTTTKQPVATTTTTTKTPATTTTTPPQTTASAKGNLTNGATVFKKNCAGCHGNTGEGNGPAASSLKPKPANFVATAYKDSKGKNPRDYTDAEILDIINNGRKGTAMPAWKKQLSAEQINDVLAYVRSLEK